ncbi:MAG: hypothetical protein KGN77_12635 [Xanthomonadaceae bacterium]|nr:hypothetical protein [Xanthomonadaceae bacterium]MDE1963391.1 hypothetical protein [Xanthomonadaceae bacterium]
MNHRPLLLACLALLTACHGASTDTPPAAPATGDAPRACTDAALGLAIAVPPDMTLRHDFQRTYLDAAAWQAFAGRHGQGRPLAALVLKGSDRITAAELRISASGDADAVAHCDDTPASAEPGSIASQALGGVTFQRFRAGDAAMGHYLQVEGYRALRGDRCVAIDLLVYGTRPELYTPPRTPPFSQARAWQALHAALAGLRWSR